MNEVEIEKWASKDEMMALIGGILCGVLGFFLLMSAVIAWPLAAYEIWRYFKIKEAKKLKAEQNNERATELRKRHELVEKNNGIESSTNERVADIRRGIVQQNNVIKTQEEKQIETRKCPFCAEEIKKEAIICRFCGKTAKEMNEYEAEMRLGKEQEVKSKQEAIITLLKNESVRREANELRRIYGKDFYISYLKDKAKEFGLGEVDLTENDIE